jgi:hypothetical protein
MRRILLSLPLVLLTLSSVVEAQTVLVPNTFTNGSVADADAMNDNFDSVLKGVNAALTTGPVSVPNTFTNGTTADADEVNANFTALETGVNTALTNRATDCATLGGTWDTGTSTCTPGPPASANYNCIIGGFCSHAALLCSLASSSSPHFYAYCFYMNVYDGHTSFTEPALSAQCNVLAGTIGSQWSNGEDLAIAIMQPINGGSQWAWLWPSICAQ